MSSKEMTVARSATEGHDWREAGEAWGDRPTDWAYLWEPYARPANLAAATDAEESGVSAGSVSL